MRNKLTVIKEITNCANEATMVLSSGFAIRTSEDMSISETSGLFHSLRLAVGSLDRLQRDLDRLTRAEHGIVIVDVSEPRRAKV
jgi:hypothetical protein